MRAVVIASLLFVCVASAALNDISESAFFSDPDSYDFATFKQEFDKSYTPFEDVRREAIFNENMNKIAAINEKYAQGILSWNAAVNKFADLTSAEMKQYKGLAKNQKHENALDFNTEAAEIIAENPIQGLPASVDWRTQNVVSPVKDQGGCGSCWAFSSTEAIESAVSLATNKAPPILAPQQFVDCVKNPNQCGGTGGCEGATQPIAFNYTIPVGLAAEADYPYQGEDGTCNAGVKKTAGIKGFVVLPSNDWNSLMTAVAHIGPISISVAAEPWQFYFGGVFDLGGLCGYDIDHAVMVDGYGVDAQSGKGFWLVRNSWGGLWGEAGYIRVFRELNSTSVTCGQDTTPGDGFGCQGGPSSIKVCGECGILSYSAYPTGAFLY